MKPARFILLFAAVLSCPRPANADEERQFLYKEIPDVMIHTSTGVSVPLTAFCKEKPTILTFAYSRCAGICYPFLFLLRDNVPSGDDAQKAYRVLVLSFDLNDTRADMADMAGLLRSPQTSNWYYGTMDTSDILRLTSAVGFRFTVDTVTGQIDHPPIVVGINRGGKIVRILKDPSLNPGMLWQVYREIEGDFVPVYRERSRTLVSCFNYDPRQGGLRASWGFLLLYTPVLLGALILWLVFHRRKSRVIVARQM